MIRGLVAYEDDSHSESEEASSLPKASSSRNTLNVVAANDKSLKSNVHAPSDSRKITKSQVIIRRPTGSHRSQARAHVSDDITRESDIGVVTAESSHAAIKASEEVQESQSIDTETVEDELSHIRALLQPPPIPGIDDWGIPPEPREPNDPTIATKLAHFHSLKRDLTNPKHFNDSLMSNKSFRNPHLYAKLVEFVDVDERTTNFAIDQWDPNSMRPEWFADQIAAYQKARSEQQAASQNSGKRTQINFTSASASVKTVAREKERERGIGSVSSRKSRFQPYGFESRESHPNLKERERSSWR